MNDWCHRFEEKAGKLKRGFFKGGGLYMALNVFQITFQSAQGLKRKTGKDVILITIVHSVHFK